MKNSIMECFSLRDVILDGIEIREDIFLKIRARNSSGICPHCLERCSHIHDFRVRKKSHSISGLKKVRILLTVHRFYCRKCNKPFTEYLPSWLNGKYRYTKIFEDLVTEALVSKSFKEVIKTFGTSAPTLISILERRRQEVPIPEGDLILNVDEHSYRGRDLKIGIAEIHNKKFLAVLDNDNQITLEKYLRTWSEEAKLRVLEVCIDMKPSYLTVIKEMLPNAKIVVDHFHVIREMCRQVDEIRKIIQPEGKKGTRRIHRFLLLKNRDNFSIKEHQKLEQVFKRYKNHPALKGAYFVKEKVREVYKCRTKTEAERKLNILLSQLEYHEVGKLKEMRDTLIRWKPYILNFFERRTTNSFIEGCHNKIKLTKRISYGFRNFKNYVLKITLALLPFLFTNLPH